MHTRNDNNLSLSSWAVGSWGNLCYRRNALICWGNLLAKGGYSILG